MATSRPELTSPREPVEAGGLLRDRKFAVDLAVLLVYLALAIWVLGPLLAQPGRVHPDAGSADPDFFAWMLRHAVRIFTAGEHPFRTPDLNAPLGVNLLANTGLLGLTVPLVPVTALFGPAVAF